MLAIHQDGTILRERYRLTNIVGQGGMGNVYRAEDLRLPGRLCAIKTVQHDLDASPEIQTQAQRQFLKEASILAQLDHPNLPKVSDFFSDGAADFLVMDYVPGKNLKELLEESQGNGRYLDEAVVRSWAEQIIDALAYLHRQDPPVVHRDIKPANIKLTPDNRIKLVDFGLVKLLLPDENRTITVMQGHGTLLYTPLEQYGSEDGHTDARTDVYAFSATLYHLLTATPPPDAKSRFLTPGNIQSPHQLNHQLTSHVSDAVMWGMEMHPDERPTTVERMRLALNGVDGRPKNGNGDETAVSELTSVLSSQWLLIIFAFTLFIIAVILTVLL